MSLLSATPLPTTLSHFCHTFLPGSPLPPTDIGVTKSAVKPSQELASYPSDEYAQIPPWKPPKAKSGKYEKRFILVGDIRTSEVSSKKVGNILWTFVGNLPQALRLQISHWLDTNGAPKTIIRQTIEPQTVVAIYKWQMFHQCA